MRFTLYRLAGGAVLIGLGLWAMTAPEDVRHTLGISVALAALFLLVLSRVHLGSSFTVRPQARALVTKGLYARIQHPLYTFLDLMLWGLIVYFDWPWAFVAWAVLLLVHVRGARLEERILQSAFGQSYDTYQSHTWF